MSSNGAPHSEEVRILQSFVQIKRQMNLRASQALKPLGIGPAQGALIRELRGLKAACLSELALVTRTDPGATGKAIESLIRKGWVKRSDHPGDKRRWQVSLTPAGEKAASKINSMYQRLAADFCAALTARECESLVQVFSKISSHLEVVLEAVSKT